MLYKRWSLILRYATLGPWTCQDTDVDILTGYCVLHNTEPRIPFSIVVAMSVSMITSCHCDLPFLYPFLHWKIEQYFISSSFSLSSIIISIPVSCNKFTLLYWRVSLWSLWLPLIPFWINNVSGVWCQR